MIVNVISLTGVWSIWSNSIFESWANDNPVVVSPKCDWRFTFKVDVFCAISRYMVPQYIKSLEHMGQVYSFITWFAVYIHDKTAKWKLAVNQI